MLKEKNKQLRSELQAISNDAHERIASGEDMSPRAVTNAIEAECRLWAELYPKSRLRNISELFAQRHDPSEMARYCTFECDLNMEKLREATTNEGRERFLQAVENWNVAGRNILAQPEG